MDHFNLKFILFFFGMVSFSSFGQDTLELDAVQVNGTSFGFKKANLYEGVQQEEYNVRGFTQLEIFESNLLDFWTSPGVTCITGKINQKGTDHNPFLELKWNKDQEGCDWVGMGFGWDGWKSKDLAYVIDTLALELIVRSKGAAFTNIPWAFCLEDYSGGQAWLGYNTSFLKANNITQEWTKVLIPLQLFPFDSYEVDATNIKQLLIQVFAAGELEVSSIKLVPFAGKLKEEVRAFEGTIQVDGVLDEWNESFLPLEKHSFAVAYTRDELYFAFDVIDDTPRQNGQEGSNLWNGDAIEIAFSTNPNANPNRKFLLLSDQHLGINCGEHPYVWNWKTNEMMKDVRLNFSSTAQGYRVELAIPTSSFRGFNINPQESLDIEVAIDEGNEKMRNKQVRWNSKAQDGFHLNPSLWGSLSFEHQVLIQQ